MLAGAWASGAGAQTAVAPVAIDPEMQPYASPGQLVDVGGGRKIHLLCMGRGSPTVILSAGSGNWAETWRKVQPAVARTTRVCAWDRAGFGFSSPSPEPQDVGHTTGDLEKALRAAKIAGPYVLVGHSLGGLETLLFADRNRRQVAGMVLEDPSFPGQGDALRKRTAFYGVFVENTRQGVARNDHCMAQAKAHPGDAAALDASCTAFPPGYPPALTAAMRPLFADPARWATRSSLLTEFETGARIAVSPARRYGAMPLVVLTATEVQPLPPGLGVSPAAKEDMTAFQQQDWPAAHDALAKLSTHGENRPVAGSSHYIHLIKPQVVIAAIEEVVAAARQAR